LESNQAERDDAPITTVEELTRLSERFGPCYGERNLGLASEFAEEHWQPHARLDEIATQCPEGFGRFHERMTNCFRRVQARSER
jgi:broad specificity phosphatase PhoE